MTSGSAEQQGAGFAVWWVCLSHQQADDCGRGMALSFLRPPFMCAYGGRSSRDGRIVAPAPPAPVPSPDPAARLGPDSPLAACWPDACLSMAAVDVQGDEGELGLSEGAGGASELGEGGVCWGARDCCGCVDEGWSRGTSSMLSILSRWTCCSSVGLLSALKKKLTSLNDGSSSSLMLLMISTKAGRIFGLNCQHIRISSNLRTHKHTHTNTHTHTLALLTNILKLL